MENVIESNGTKQKIQSTVLSNDAKLATSSLPRVVGIVSVADIFILLFINKKNLAHDASD